MAIALIGTSGQLMDTDESPPGSSTPQTLSLSAAEMLALAIQAERSGSTALAEQILTVVAVDAKVEIRNEARFRLAQLVARQGRYREAAVLLRQILDEQPDAQPVRLEFARILDLLGDESGARKSLRHLQAGELPEDVALLVDRYSAALRARKSLGGNVEIALAPDSNINRATRSDSLGTVLGEFVLDESAKQRSGVGLSFRGQAFARAGLDKTTNLFGRLSASTNQYSDSEFNDAAISVSLGPEFAIGTDRLSIEAGTVWRWFGGELYSTAKTITTSWIAPVSRRAQIRTGTHFAFMDNRFNRQQDSTSYSATIGLESAVSQRSGAGMNLAADRQIARDPAYSTFSWQAGVVGYHDLGSATIIGSFSVGRLEADERLSLYPRKRSEWSYRIGAGSTFRSIRIGTFSPTLQIAYERNFSTIEIYDYKRTRLELGFARSF